MFKSIILLLLFFINLFATQTDISQNNFLDNTIKLTPKEKNEEGNTDSLKILIIREVYESFQKEL